MLWNNIFPPSWLLRIFHPWHKSVNVRTYEWTNTTVAVTRQLLNALLEGNRQKKLKVYCLWVKFNHFQQEHLGYDVMIWRPVLYYVSLRVHVWFTKSIHYARPHSAFYRLAQRGSVPLFTPYIEARADSESQWLSIVRKKRHDSAVRLHDLGVFCSIKQNQTWGRSISMLTNKSGALYWFCHDEFLARRSSPQQRKRRPTVNTNSRGVALIKGERRWSLHVLLFSVFNVKCCTISLQTMELETRNV